MDMSDATSPAGFADTSLIDLVETQVGRTPERVAAECDGRSISYAQLWADAGNIARGLLADGARHGDLIGVCLSRSVGLLAALLGILRAGCAYVPLDAGFPDRRLRTMIERASLDRIVVCAGDELPEAIHASDAKLFDIADATPIASDTALPRVAGGDRAYVLFTSGSTGEPKGVCVLHRNLVNFLRSMRERPGLTADDVLCAVTTLSFDIAGLEMYLPLTVGARIRIATEDESHDPNLLGPLLQTSGATVLQATPTQLRMLVDRGQLAHLHRLRLLVGGEAMPRDLANEVGAHCRELWNMYGPTETTVWSTLWRVP
jgi:non-ribosomal peptide synthetase component F